MNSIVICEKASQARDVRAAVGSKYGEVIAAQGHVMRLAEPEEVVPEWKRWSALVLMPPGGRYPLKEARRSGKADRLGKLKPALKGASVIYVATDCDREGTLIGGELVKSFANPRATIKRVVFTAQDRTTLRKAFAEARPWTDFTNELAAGEARCQADQIYNLSLTRTATVLLKPARQKGAIGIGRVKTPTLAIVCRRDLAIRNFKVEDYFEVTAKASVPSGTFLLRHAPKARIKNHAAAEAIAESAADFTGPLKVVVEAKRQRPPRLFDLPTLQKACSARWGWAADKTLEVAQGLYEAHVITYPRAESRYLTESQIPDASKLMPLLADLYDFKPPPRPVIRKGKSGTFSDKALQGVSHHAVIPNVNGELIDKVPQIHGDGRKLFDLVARAYLAALLPDHHYQQTTVSMLVAGRYEFRAMGRITTAPGWKAVYSDRSEGGKAGDENAEQQLPPLTDGESAHLSSAKVEAKKTKPPPHYTEGTLIQAMQEAWRFIPEKHADWRDRLKEAKGIGTPATRAEIIKGLKKQGLLALRGKQIISTDQGMALYELLADVVPRLVDPAVTAVWESRLDLVTLGKVDADKIITDIAGEAGKAIEALKVRGGAAANLPGKPANGNSPRGLSPGTGNAPSKKQLAFAEKLAKERGVPLPETARTDRRICGSFIDRLLQIKCGGGTDANGGHRPPTDKQIAFARKLATEAKIELPTEALQDGKACSNFIDKALGGRGSNKSRAGNSSSNYRRRRRR